MTKNAQILAGICWAFFTFFLISPVNATTYSKYRIQVSSTPSEELEKVKTDAEQLGASLSLSVYLVQQGSRIKLTAGDFEAYNDATEQLNLLRSEHPLALIVRANNVNINAYKEASANNWIVLKSFDVKSAEIPADLVMAGTIKKEVASTASTTTATKRNHIPTSSEIRSSSKYSKKINFTEYLDNLPVQYRTYKYNKAHTARDTKWLSDTEKEVYFYLNLARMNPKLFAKTMLPKNAATTKEYYLSTLYKTLMSMEPQPMLTPSSGLWQSAKCHAITSGKTGYVGHARQEGACKSSFRGECCAYGSRGGKAIILALLIDRGVESLGHRRICLGGYKTLGVSIQPHKGYGTNAVLDFGYR
jgi:hypothetical protein